MSGEIFTKQRWKGSALCAPLPPVLITCGFGGKVNILTVAWTGILCTRPPVTYISLRPERYSYDLIKNSGEFVVNLPTEKLVRAVDYCGVRSGKDTDKFRDMRLTPLPCGCACAPMLGESPVSIECKVREVIPLGSHHMFIADIDAVNAAEELLDQNGRLALDKGRLLAYSHGEYFSLGEKLGSFGFSVRKKSKKKRPPR